MDLVSCPRNRYGDGKHPTFPPPLPDELLWSTVARWSSMFYGLQPEFFLRELGVHTMSASMPVHLRRIAANIPVELGLTAELLRDRHTMYPFVAPFCRENRIKQVGAEMVQGESSVNLIRSWQLALGLDAHVPLRFCCACREVDRETWGFEYWHRSHQIRGFDFCFKHLISLTEAPVVHGSSPTALGSLPRSPIGTPIPANSLFGRHADQLTAFQCTVALPGRDRLREELYRLIMHKTGELFNRHTLDGITDFLCVPMGPLTLEDARRMLSHEEIILGPQLYAHLALSIGSPLGEILNAAHRQQVEAAPWPCLDDTSKCFGKLTIHKSTRNKDGIHRSFVCPECGAGYRRKAPLKRNSDGSFDYEIFRRSRAWAHDLPELWSAPGTTWKTLESHYGRSSASIAKAAIKLGLTDQPNRSLQSFRSKNPHSDIKAQVDGKRAQWLELNAALKAGTAEFRTPERTALKQWLSRHDTAWYVAHKLKRVGGSGRLRTDPGPRDATALAALSQIAAEMLALREGRRRPVAKTDICKALSAKLKWSVTKISGLPKTMDRILQMVETDEQFVFRRLSEARVHFKSERTTPYFLRLWLNIRLQTRRNPNLKAAADSAMQEILARGAEVKTATSSGESLPNSVESRELPR